MTVFSSPFIADSVPDQIFPDGHIVDIETEMDEQTKQQIGPIAMHVIIDAGYFDYMMKTRTIRNYNGKQIWSKADDSQMITWIENKLQSLNLFGSGQNYQTIVHPGIPRDKAPGSIVLYAQSSLPHQQGCKYEKPRDEAIRKLIKSDVMEEGDYCGACRQRSRHDALKYKGWIVHNPPLRESLIVPWTEERVREIKETLHSLIIPNKIMEAADAAIAANDIMFFTKFLRDIENKQHYADKVVSEVFGKIEYELSRKAQKGVDTRIAGALSDIAEFSKYKGGRHAIALVAGDSDYQNNTWRCVMNSAFSMSAKHRHGSPRARIAVFNFGQGTSDGLMTGRHLDTFKNDYPATDWYYDTIREGLKSYEFTQRDLEEFTYVPKFVKDRERGDGAFHTAQRRNINS